jgi:hypothetical protein
MRGQWGDCRANATGDVLDGWPDGRRYDPDGPCQSAGEKKLFIVVIGFCVRYWTEDCGNFPGISALFRGELMRIDILARLRMTGRIGKVGELVERYPE